MLICGLPTSAMGIDVVIKEDSPVGLIFLSIE